MLCKLGDHFSHVIISKLFYYQCNPPTVPSIIAHAHHLELALPTCLPVIIVSVDIPLDQIAFGDAKREVVSSMK